MEVGKLHMSKAEKSSLASSLSWYSNGYDIRQNKRIFAYKTIWIDDTKRPLTSAGTSKLRKLFYMQTMQPRSILWFKNCKVMRRILFFCINQLVAKRTIIQELTRDFLLGIMNDAQEKLLELYFKNCVTIDSTHGIGQYNFQLTTLMVHDENITRDCPLQHFFHHE
ncbi:hypothetical protein TNCT_439991 [Trichonephila clavata]|uniref:Uncharacterized protein n=1 Tax=Trichonephila clavata TaxID=2740835 RepID=A0A8X6JAC1_TRICU|nr:hypothetical protein TNCT_439991 [Trichonephila clavata]